MAVSDEIKEQKKKFRDLTFKGKLSYIWDYYKVYMIIAAVVIAVICMIVRDISQNNKPTHLYAAFINSNFSFDDTNTLLDDYIRCENIDTGKEQVYITYDMNFDSDYYDTVSIAYEQKLVSMYSAGDIDIVAGPVDIMETAADCGQYANLEEVLPKDLMDELKDKEYEFYTYKGHRYDDDELSYLSEEELKEIEDFEPYIAGIYLDTCPYLSNMGEYGAYDLTEDPDKRPILTIPATTKRLDTAIDFIRFITE